MEQKTIRYEFNFKSIDKYDKNEFQDMQETMIEGNNGDVYYVMDQLMDVDDDNYIRFEGQWTREVAEDDYLVDFKEFDENDIAAALGSWRQDHGILWDGTCTIIINDKKTIYDDDGNVHK